MRLIFLTFSPISMNAGHMRRLLLQLNYFNNFDEIKIVYLGTSPNENLDYKKSNNITLVNLKTEFSGWDMLNLDFVIKKIKSISDDFSPDLIVLQMEVWDLVNPLIDLFKNNIPIALVLHAMPFLCAPVNISGNFKKDVLKYSNSGIAEFKRVYNKKRYREAEVILLSNMIFLIS